MTKALNHVTKTKGKDVKPCSGSIPKHTLDGFKAFRDRKNGTKTAKRQHAVALTDTVSENQKSLAVMFKSKRSRPSNTGNSTVDGSVEASNATILTTAIADFVHTKGLPFSTTEGPQFQNILHLS